MLSENRVILVTYFNIYTHKFKNSRKKYIVPCTFKQIPYKKEKILDLKIGGNFDRNGGEVEIEPNRRRKPRSAEGWEHCIKPLPDKWLFSSLL